MTTFLENDGYEVRIFVDRYSICQTFDEQIPDMYSDMAYLGGGVTLSNKNPLLHLPQVCRSFTLASSRQFIL